MVEEYRRRREYIIKALSEIKELSFYEPQGAFYVFIDVSKTGQSGADFCLGLLNKKGVATASGESFGKEWVNYIRISYCCSMEDLKEAIKLIKEYIKEIDS